MTFFNTQRGFSFVETIITIAITTTVIGVLIGSIIFFYRSNAYAVEQAFAVESARKGVEVMVRDIREASYSDSGVYPVISIADNELWIYSDTDRDNDVEQIRFFLDDVNKNFMKVTTNSTGTPPSYVGGESSTSTVAHDVRNIEQNMVIFEYYDDTGMQIDATSTANVTDVSFVRVNMIVNINPIRLPNEFVLRSSATMRNLKTNL